jgi:hypothetical protein
MRAASRELCNKPTSARSLADRVPLPEAMLTELRRIWSTHRNPRWLTPDRSGTDPVSKNALWRTFRLAARAAGIKRPVSPHSLRHSYATRLPGSSSLRPYQRRCANRCSSSRVATAAPRTIRPSVRVQYAGCRPPLGRPHAWKIYSPRLPQPPFSPTEFLRRLRAPETLTSFTCVRLPQPCLPGSLPRRFRDAHYHGIWPQQLAVA